MVIFVHTCIHGCLSAEMPNIFNSLIYSNEQLMRKNCCYCDVVVVKKVLSAKVPFEIFKQELPHSKHHTHEIIYFAHTRI
jgi:hypothetical protein